MSKYKFITSTVVAIVDDDGVSRGSCLINNPKYVAWLADGGETEPADPPTQAEIDASAKAAKDSADAAAANSYAKLTALKTMTPAQVQAWVATNVTNLAQAQDAIATLAIGVGILARRI